MIPYGRQSINEADIQAVVEVLRSDYLTQGPMVPNFERAMCQYTGAPHAVAVTSGTSGLHIACLALGVGPGDYVWTSPVTFVASANCALYCGALVDFVDIDPESGNMCVEKLTSKLEEAASKRQLPKAVVCVHLAGLSCDMVRISELAGKYGFKVIEDACHALGGRFHGRPIGCGERSDATVFSFHPVKAITTGEGGMVLTRSAEVANRMRLLRSHGITRDPEEMTRFAEGPWYYEQLCLGYNYRMTDIQAALGSSQLRRLDAFTERRRMIATEYDRRLSDLPIQLPLRDRNAESAHHLYVIRYGVGRGKRSHTELFNYLRSSGIGVNLHYIPVHYQPHYRSLGFKMGDFPEAERYYQEAISIPIFQDMTQLQVDAVVNAFAKAF